MGKSVICILTVYSLFCVHFTLCDKIYLYTKILPLYTNTTSTTHPINTSFYEVSREHVTPRINKSTLTLIKLEACNEHLNPEYNYTAKDEVNCEEPQRETRSIIGEDNRELANRTLYPYKALVDISNRCNGVAIGYKYVLTSAQCVYFGYFNYPRVSVIWVINGETRQTEVEIESVLLPIEWIEIKNNYAERFKYNYALIKLKTDQQTYIPIHMNTPTEYESQCFNRITQIGFNFTDNNIIRSTCNSQHETFSTTFLRCDSNVNDLGNPLLTVVRRNAYFAITVAGILLGDYGKYYLNNQIDGQRYNLGLRINYEMFLRLCTWMNRLDKCTSHYRQYFPIDSLKEIEDW